MSWTQRDEIVVPNDQIDEFLSEGVDPDKIGDPDEALTPEQGARYIEDRQMERTHRIEHGVSPVEGVEVAEDADPRLKRWNDEFAAKRYFVRLAEWAVRNRVLSWFVPVAWVVRQIDKDDRRVYISGWPTPAPEPKPLAHTWWGGHRWGPWSIEDAVVHRRSGDHEIAVQQRWCQVGTCHRYQAERIGL